MTIQEILDLGKMGYTKADIEKMGGVDPKQEPKEEPKQEPEEEEPKQEPNQAPDNNAKFLEDLNKTLSGFISDLQKQNIINSNNRKEQKESAEEILASIIAPPLRKGEKTK